MWIVKIGGGASINIRGIIQGLADFPEPFIIVHGANYIRDEMSRKLGLPRETITSISGYTSVLSDEITIDLQMMMYAGLRNKRIVEMCQQSGIQAVGLSGLDGALIRARRNRGIKVKLKGRKKIIRDLSGKPVEINMHLLELLLTNGYTPVLTVPLLDEQGFAVNSENDDVVALIQKELNAEVVIHFIEAAGFLADPENPESGISIMTKAELPQWEIKSVGRMRRKLRALMVLFDHGVQRAILSDGRVEHPMEHALCGNGTVIE